MYINYIEDRKSMGYAVVLDTSCGIRLVLITDSITHRTQRVILISVLGVTLWFSNIKPSEAMGLSIPHVSTVRVQPSLEHPLKKIKIEKLVPRKPDRISYKCFYKSKEELLLLIYATDPRLSSNKQVLKIVNELRGRSWVGVLGSAAFFGLIYVIVILSGGTESFVPPQPNFGWGLPKGLYDPPGLVRPADCGTQLHAGSPTQSLKTWEDRNQPNPKDRWLLVESRPELVLRRGQSKFKTKDHGALAGLPYSVKKNGATSTLKTEEKVDAFMDAVEEIVYDPNNLWFEEGTYQAGTDRETESINIYNEKHNRIAVFLRSTGEFPTFCEPTPDELVDLSQTANFGGQDNWFSGTPKNMPPQQEFVSNFTPVNSFENDVLGITPVDPDWHI